MTGTRTPHKEDTMDASNIFLLALLLACPLMMVFMHRGHSGKNADHSEHHTPPNDDDVSLDELRARRGDLDAEIARREEIESDEPKVRR